MFRRLVALVVALAVVPTTAFADPEVQNYVEYQNAKLLTYQDAYLEYSKTKKPVVVWVKATDATAYETWKATKSEAIHVFVTDFLAIKEGLVVGGDRKGEFVVLTKTTYGPTEKMVETIRKAIAPKLVSTTTDDCPNGQCPIRYTIPASNCPNGQCQPATRYRR